MRKIKLYMMITMLLAAMSMTACLGPSRDKDDHKTESVIETETESETEDDSEGPGLEVEESIELEVDDGEEIVIG